MEGGQEVTYAYTSDNNTVTVIGDPSVSGHEIQLEPNSSSQAQQIFQVSNNSIATDRSQKASTPFTPVGAQNFLQMMLSLTAIFWLDVMMYQIFLNSCFSLFRQYPMMKT